MQNPNLKKTSLTLKGFQRKEPTHITREFLQRIALIRKEQANSPSGTTTGIEKPTKK